MARTRCNCRPRNPAKLEPRAMQMNDDLGEPQSSVQRIVRKSAIVYTLNETLHDAAALAYFIQFMEEIVIKNDASHIFAKYLSEDASCSIGITDHLRKSVIDRIFGKSGFFDVNCFSEAQQFVLNIMENRYFKEFMDSIYYTKHRLDVISSGLLKMHDIMLCQPLLCAFVEYMENEGERKLVEFIISVETFAEQLPQTESNEQAMEDAMIIYNRYFSMQAMEPLKFGAKIRIQIESDICSGIGRPAPGCFEAARLMALRILEQNYLKRFSASPAFVKYLQELLSQVESNVELPNPNIRKRTLASSSDQSSDISLPWSMFERPTYRSLSYLGPSSASAALLPMGSEEDESASQPDSLSSCSTNTLRTGRSRTNISLATVDDMGRYRPMYDNSYSISESAGNARRKLKNKLDRYLHSSIKKEAEVADQVAQLIVADVHSMVSAGSAPGFSDF